jgi:hypothetical protein
MGLVYLQNQRNETGSSESHLDALCHCDSAKLFLYRHSYQHLAVFLDLNVCSFIFALRSLSV